MSALTEDVIRSMTPKQLEIMKRFRELGLQEKEVGDAIEEILSKGSFVRNGAIVPCSDADDWKVVNLGSEKHPLYVEYEEVEEEIKENIQQALKEGLGFLGFVQRQCENYGIKMPNA